MCIPFTCSPCRFSPPLPQADQAQHSSEFQQLLDEKMIYIKRTAAAEVGVCLLACMLLVLCHNRVLLMKHVWLGC